MHLLAAGTGLVVRAFVPHASAVEIQPVHEKDKPVIKLKRIPRTDLFEGVSKEADRVYAYDLVITDEAGNQRRTRDPYSFLPTLGEGDLYLFGKGDERRIYDKLGSQLRTIDGVDGTSFAVWAPNAQRVSVVGDFNHWDGRCHPMRNLGASPYLENPELVEIKAIMLNNDPNKRVNEFSMNISVKRAKAEEGKGAAKKAADAKPAGAKK